MGCSDVTFFVGVDAPGLKSCFVLTPRTFATAEWDQGPPEKVVVETSGPMLSVWALDDAEEEIEAARAQRSAEALRGVLKEATEALQRRWAEEEDS